MSLSPAPTRTFVLSTLMSVVASGIASPGRVVTIPPKAGADVIDWWIDCTALLNPSGDSLSAFTVTVVTTETDGELAVNSTNISGAFGGFLLSGGLSGETYQLVITITTTSGRTLALDALAPVRVTTEGPFLSLTYTQTIVTLSAGVDAVIIAANPARKSLSFEVIDTGDVNLAFGQAAVVGSGFALAAANASGKQGGGFDFGQRPPGGAVHGISSAGTRIAVLEGV